VTAATLRKLRLNAPVEDLQTEALALPPFNTTRRYPSRYEPPHLRPNNLVDLGKACGKYGQAAIRDAEWAACLAFLRMASPSILQNDVVLARASVEQCRMADRATLGYPTVPSRESADLPLAQPTKLYANTVRVANETLDDWKRDDRRCLASEITRTHTSIVGIQREAQNALRVSS
jgi:hypothetical protein